MKHIVLYVFIKQKKTDYMWCFRNVFNYITIKAFSKCKLDVPFVKVALKE